MTLEQSIARSVANTKGDMFKYESRWKKTFKMPKKLMRVTGVMASFVGAIATGLQLFRDIKNGAAPAVIAVETIEVKGCCFAYLVMHFSIALH